MSARVRRGAEGRVALGAHTDRRSMRDPLFTSLMSRAAGPPPWPAFFHRRLRSDTSIAHWHPTASRNRRRSTSVEGTCSTRVSCERHMSLTLPFWVEAARPRSLALPPYRARTCVTRVAPVRAHEAEGPQRYNRSCRAIKRCEEIDNKARCIARRAALTRSPQSPRPSTQPSGRPHPRATVGTPLACRWYRSSTLPAAPRPRGASRG